MLYPALLLILLLLAGTGTALEVCLPSDMFEYTISGEGQRAPGYYYLAVESANLRTGRYRAYLLVLDNRDRVRYFRRSEPDLAYANFTPFPSARRFAVAVGGADRPEEFLLMDDTYRIIDRVDTDDRRGLSLDGHEILLEEDGTRWTLWRERQVFDMTEYGGVEDCIVEGHVIIHATAAGEILWEWRSLEHLEELPFTFIDNQSRLEDDWFEHLHLNTIELDHDGNLLTSARDMSLIFKIDYQTGDVLWRCGGGSGSQFTFTGEFDIPLDFQMQHDVRRLSNGNITLFDNGNYHDPQVSYAREYILDEEALTAELAWYHSADPPLFGPFTGGTRRLENGNTLVGWGAISEIGGCEVTTEGETVWQIAFELDPVIDGYRPFSYRYYKSELIGTAEEPYLCHVPLDCGVELVSNWFGHEEEVAAYNIYSGRRANPTELLGVTDSGRFIAEGLEVGGRYFFRARAVNRNGREISDYSNEIEVVIEEMGIAEANEALPLKMLSVETYPNPFNSLGWIIVRPSVPTGLNIRIFDLAGREAAKLTGGMLPPGPHRFRFDGTGLPSGNYFIRIESTDYPTVSRRIILLK